MTETVVHAPALIRCARQARRLVRDLVHAERVDDATLLVSELVTNAVKYGPEEETIRLIVEQARTAHALHRARPRPRAAARDARRETIPPRGGHGLRLVDALADRWGVERGSTRVWFELDC